MRIATLTIAAISPIPMAMRELEEESRTLDAAVAHFKV